jgi:hypothetical protein
MLYGAHNPKTIIALANVLDIDDVIPIMIAGIPKEEIAVM